MEFQISGNTVLSLPELQYTAIPREKKPEITVYRKTEIVETVETIILSCVRRLLLYEPYYVAYSNVLFVDLYPNLKES